MWLLGTYVLHHMSNSLLVQAVAGHIVHCCAISSCLFVATPKVILSLTPCASVRSAIVSIGWTNMT